MKKVFSSWLVVIMALVLSNSSQAQCPDDTLDLGFCDSLHVVPWPETDTCFIAGTDTICINDPGEDFPCFLHVPFLVTHDSNTFYCPENCGPEPMWVQDSIAAFVVPLAWTHTNPAAYCSLSAYWNENSMNPYDPRFPRSVWRHFEPSELDSNRMARLAGQFQDLEWSTAIFDMTSDSSWFHYHDDSLFVPPHMWMVLLPTEPANRRWWEGERTLLATLTFRVEDTMHVCIDSTWWPPNSHLEFSRYDARSYVPRHDMPVCVRVGQARIEVTSPNGGENWCAGSTQLITWTAAQVTDVKIEYSTNGGADWNTIVSSTPSDGEHSWDIPSDLSTSTACRVKISDLDGDPFDISDDDFTITEKSLAVISPNGGETWVVDSTYDIVWSSACIESVRIEYSTDGGINWLTIVDVTGADYAWQVPDTPSDSCRVRTCDVGGAPCDTSDDDFTIIGPSIAVTSPNGEESWCGGKTQLITWAAQYITDVKIEYSKTGGPPWETIAASTPNDGEYSWDIPSDLAFSATYKARISDSDGDPSDASDGDFTIFKAGDANSDDMVDVGDVIYMANYLFLSGSAPIPLEAGDVNLDGEVDVGDVIYLVNFLFLDGAAPLC